MDNPVFYHGGASEPMLEKAERIAPSFTHGNGWTPGKDGKCYDRPNRNYFLDNGAFTGSFDEKAWIDALEKISGFESDPDFVVLPDAFDDARATWRLHEKYADIVKAFEQDFYYVIQPGYDPAKSHNIVLEKAKQLGADGLFLGGSWHKPSNFERFRDAAHNNGLKIHIGMPKDLTWAATSGADSFDTTSVIQNQNWDRLRKVEAAVTSQTTLEEVKAFE